MDLLDYARLLLDPLRLSILGRAAEGPVRADEVAEAHGISKKEALVVIGKLTAQGLLNDHGELVREVLVDMVDQTVRPMDAHDVIVDAAWDAEEAKVLRTFFSGARLTSIPAAMAKKRVILNFLAQQFEIGRRYTEREVNEVLLRHHHDYAALRRYMVEDGIMDREAGEYWRSGGRVDLE